MSGKIYPIGIQNFESLRNDGYFYIDKTALIYQLVKTQEVTIFESSAPFWQKSAHFYAWSLLQGKQELFEGLAMEKLKKIANIPFYILILIRKNMILRKVWRTNSMGRWWNGKIYGAEALGEILSDAFWGLLNVPAGRKDSVWLFLWMSMTSRCCRLLVMMPCKRAAIHWKLSMVHFKSQDGCIKFAMLTGVTKFGKFSVFSDLNNLNDISME